jgi:hypothetical protein
MPFRWKLINLCFVVLPKVYIWLLMVDIGTLFLMETAGIEDMIMNAVALSFILSIDELICSGLFSDTSKHMLETIEPLPLFEVAASPHGVPFAFASGLAVHNGTVMISYGVGDRAARALVLTLDRLDEMFAHCAVSTPWPSVNASLVTAPPKTTPHAHCGVDLCTEEVWARMAGHSSCGDRISWLQTAEGGSLTERWACFEVASAHPTECGTCASATTATPTTAESSSVYCGVEACTEEVWARMAGAFPCGGRIDWLQTVEGGSLNESAACFQIASERPAECGTCAP